MSIIYMREIFINEGKECSTLKKEILAGRKFRGFRGFC